VGRLANNEFITVYGPKLSLHDIEINNITYAEKNIGFYELF